MKKLTHPELRLKSIQNFSRLSSFGGNSCRQKQRGRQVDRQVITACRDSDFLPQWSREMLADMGRCRPWRTEPRACQQAAVWLHSGWIKVHHLLWSPWKRLTKFRKRRQSWRERQTGQREHRQALWQTGPHSPLRSLCLWCHRRLRWCHGWRTTDWLWALGPSWASDDTEPLIGWPAARSLKESEWVRSDLVLPLVPVLFSLKLC